MSALFDTTDYEVPFPEVDGHRVDELGLAISGNLKLNRNNPDHTTFIESLTLGKRVTLNAYAIVASKRQGYRTHPDDTEQTDWIVALKIESLDFD